MIKHIQALPVLDRSALEKLTGFKSGSLSLVAVLSRAFEESASFSLKQMQEALAVKNLAEMKQAAHRLKSASATLGLERVRYICNEIELSQVWPSDSPLILATLKNELETAQKELFASGEALS